MFSPMPLAPVIFERTLDSPQTRFLLKPGHQHRRANAASTRNCSQATRTGRFIALQIGQQTHQRNGARRAYRVSARQTATTPVDGRRVQAQRLAEAQGLQGKGIVQFNRLQISRAVEACALQYGLRGNVSG
jgi:hypothetical protein